MVQSFGLRVASARIITETLASSIDQMAIINGDVDLNFEPFAMMDVIAGYSTENRDKSRTPKIGYKS